MMKKLLVALLVLYPLSAFAVTYEWTDEHGTVNFTEDLGKVPKKFRKRAKVLGGEDSTPQTTILPETSAEKPKGEEGQKAKKLYGGRDEVAWRKDFISVRRELQQAEADVAELRGRLNDTSRMSRSEYLAIQNTINHNEVRVRGLQKKLDLLQDSADRAGVPAEFRQ
jgi:hypothetical protein